MEGRRIRVFISSTFRDMHAERDHLVTVAFPELRTRMPPHFLALLGECYDWMPRLIPFGVPHLAGLPASQLDSAPATQAA